MQVSMGQRGGREEARSEINSNSSNGFIHTARIDDATAILYLKNILEPRDVK